MELIRGLHNLRERHQGCVATIGNFDGVHLGHQCVLQQVKNRAKEFGLPSVVIIFEPQPREYFAPDAAPARLTRFGEKVRLLEAQGIDRVLCLTFNSRLRHMTAHQFIDELLRQKLNVKHFVVGDDFRFGCDRAGDYELLKAAGVKHGFSVEETLTLQVDGARVSSTRVRTALQQNELKTAATLLGRAYRVTGRVIHGRELGRTIGAPTANIRMHRFPCPLRGVYVVAAHMKGKTIQGICNVGYKPTVQGHTPSLEVHLFDFSADIYGQLVSVEFLHFIRDERRFDGIDALKSQIKLDVEQAREWLAAHPMQTQTGNR